MAPHGKPCRLTPDISALVVRKIRNVNALLLLSSTSKAFRTAVWTPLIAWPRFALNSAGLAFIKQAQQHLGDKRAIVLTHYNHEPFAYHTYGKTVQLSVDGNSRFLTIHFEGGDAYFSLEFKSGQDGYYKIFPDSGHLEYSENSKLFEYDPPHLLAKLVEMGVM